MDSPALLRPRDQAAKGRLLQVWLANAGNLRTFVLCASGWASFEDPFSDPQTELG